MISHLGYTVENASTSIFKQSNSTISTLQVYSAKTVSIQAIALVLIFMCIALFASAQVGWQSKSTYSSGDMEMYEGQAWKKGKKYKKHAVVEYQGRYYKAAKDIAAGNVFISPLNDSNLWELQWEDFGAWVIGLPYLQDMVVLSNGYLYQAKTSITAKFKAPYENEAEWLKLANYADLYAENEQTTSDIEEYSETRLQPSDGKLSSFSDEDKNGQWTKIADVTIKEQYFQATMILEFVGGTSGSDTEPSDVGYAEILFRVKQQLPFPTYPHIQLEMITSNANKQLSAEDFKARMVSVDGSGTTGEAVVELYVRVVPQWEQLKYSYKRLSFFDTEKVEVNMYNESEFIKTITGELTNCILLSDKPLQSLQVNSTGNPNRDGALQINVNNIKDKAITVNRNNAEVFRVLGNGVVNAKKIYAEEFEVTLQAMDKWYDHVFAQDYDLMSIPELQEFIIKHKHLPDIPSEQEVREQGFELKEMNALLLKKVEELTLYIIQLEQRIDGLEKSK